MSNVPTGITAYRNQETGEIAGSYPRPEMQRVQELQEANAILAQQAADWYALYSRAMKGRSEDARDAARYRWLRDVAEATDWEMFGYQDRGRRDAAIDDAMGRHGAEEWNLLIG